MIYNEKNIAQAVTGIRDEATLRRLLQTAAVQTIQAQAGYIGQQTRYAPPDTYRVDNRPICDAVALAYLDVLLRGYSPQILWQWTMLIDARGERVPDEYLPGLLDSGAQVDWMLQPHLKQFLGKRAVWLAHQAYAMHPHWRWIADVETSAVDAKRSALNLQHKITRILRDNLREARMLRGLEELRFRAFPWTETLTQSFVLYLDMQARHAQKELQPERYLYAMIAHYAPVSAREKILRELLKHPRFLTEERDYIEHVMAFRARLIRELQRGVT